MGACSAAYRAERKHATRKHADAIMAAARNVVPRPTLADMLPLVALVRFVKRMQADQAMRREEMELERAEQERAREQRSGPRPRRK